MSEAAKNILVKQQDNRGLADFESARSPEVKSPYLDAILIFGQGPVLNKETRVRSNEDNTMIIEEADINMWAKTLATSAYELYKRGQTREFIVLGGRTGGEAYLSEADMIAEEMIRHGVPPEAIQREQRSSNTLENIANVLNDYVDSKSQYRKLGLLGSNFHIPRIKLLMEIFSIPYKGVFSAEEVMRYAAREGEDFNEWDHGMLLEIEKRLDMADATKTPVSGKDRVNLYYQNKQGEEQKNIARRGQEEDVYTRALLSVPENWLMYVGRLSNTERMLKILARQDQQMLKNKFGIDLAADKYDDIRQKLLAIKRIVLHPDEWISQEWPKETIGLLDAVIEERQK